MSDIPTSTQQGERVSAVVKWFNPTKGFGFVQPDDGSPDAFLHVSVLEQAGYRDVQDASVVMCEITQGPKGPQVSTIFDIQAPPPGGDGTGEPVEGTVKFFDAGKGFGFVVPDNGDKDVFISARALERSGLSALEPAQRVRVTTRMGQKGPMADSIELV